MPGDAPSSRNQDHLIPSCEFGGKVGVARGDITPPDAHRWFMEMYVDSSDWVMGPNVYGMGIFSDGGVFDRIYKPGGAATR